MTVQEVHTDGPHSVLAELIGSAEQPAAQPVPRPSSSSSAARPASQPVDLEDPTPFWNSFLDEIPSTADHQAIIEYIALKCFFGDTLHKEFRGEWLGNPKSFSDKMEVLLMESLDQRKQHINWLRDSADPRCSAEHPANDDFLIFNEEDMKNLYNRWRADVGSYMSAANLQRHRALPRQKAHLLEKSAFSTYQFHLSGCKWLLREFLRLPIVAAFMEGTTSSAVQPAWRELLAAFEEHKTTEAYRKTVEASKKKEKDHVRLSQRLWEARRNHIQGHNISFRVRAGTVQFTSLSQTQQKLAEDYEAGRSARSLDAVMKEKDASSPKCFHLLRIMP